MLSILIPIYNYDASGLISTLHRLCVGAQINFEIRLLDDASIEPLKQKNRAMLGLPNVCYRELPANVGRAAIRNQLATEAQYRYLLFIDCDAKIFSDSYISTYVALLQPGIVAFGGIAYTTEKPDRNYQLRWYYGRRYEALKATTRNKHPWKSFSFFNTLIDKETFLLIQCNEVIRRYGHEDTLFGYMLEKAHIKITHIENPLHHLGLNTNRAFLAKTKEGIESLRALSTESNLSVCINQNQILCVSNQFKKYHLLPLFSGIYILVGKSLEKIICVYPNNITLFQCLKLLYFSFFTWKSARKC